MAPDFKVFGDKNLTFTYVPSHLHLILFEILKNSMRAVTEMHGKNAAAADDGGSGSLPMIKIAIANGEEDVTIKVSDEGGGVFVAVCLCYIAEAAAAATAHMKS